MNAIESTSFIKWFNLFLSEKNIPYAMFELNVNDEVHLIDNTTVIDLIKNASSSEQSTIRAYLVYLDFKSADINDYLKHLAKAYISENSCEW